MKRARMHWLHAVRSPKLNVLQDNGNCRPPPYLPTLKQTKKQFRTRDIIIYQHNVTITRVATIRGPGEKTSRQHACVTDQLFVICDVSRAVHSPQSTGTTIYLAGRVWRHRFIWSVASLAAMLHPSYYLVVRSLEHHRQLSLIICFDRGVVSCLAFVVPAVSTMLLIQYCMGKCVHRVEFCKGTFMTRLHAARTFGSWPRSFH